MEGIKKPVANPMVVLREEFDDWALLFDTDTNDIFTIDPVSVFIWKRLDGRHGTEDIVKELKPVCEDMPGDAPKHIDDFLEDLVKHGLAGYEIKKKTKR